MTLPARITSCETCKFGIMAREDKPEDRTCYLNPPILDQDTGCWLRPPVNKNDFCKHWSGSSRSERREVI